MAKHSLLTAALSPTGTGDQVGIAAVAGKSIVVVALTFVASAATVVTFKDGAGGTALTGAMSFAINGGMSNSAPADDSFLFRTSPGNALTANQSVDGIDGFMTYYLVG
jgi:hypothetical protein